MRRFGPAQLAITLAGALALWAVVAVGCLMVGSTGVHWPSGDLFTVRRNAVLLASLVGAALASAGCTYQAVLRNTLAEPYLLGVSSGASLAAVLWRLPLVSPLMQILPGPVSAAMSQQAFAFAGACVAVAVVFTLGSARGRLEPVTLLLVGVIVNALNASLFLLINAIYVNIGAQSGGVFTFLVGGIQTDLTAEQQLVPTAIVLAAWLLLMFHGGKLNAAVVGDAEAQSLGLSIHTLRWIALGIASLMTAAAVSVSGPIAFVGLICPHVGRLMVGNDQRRLLPISTAVGAALLAVADAISRLMLSEQYLETMLPVGVLTGLLGGPFFLFLLYRTRQSQVTGESRLLIGELRA